MNILQTFFGSQSPTREELEVEKQKRTKHLLWAMVALNQRHIRFPSPREISVELGQLGCNVGTKELKMTIDECVMAGFVQRIGQTEFSYILSACGRKHIGLQGNKY
jgi:hypothetical protein